MRAAALGVCAAFSIAARPVAARADEAVFDEGLVVRGARVAEPARPDTERRLTAEQLSERGLTDLGQALDLLTDTPVRGSGRQLAQTNIRGARKGGVLILIDGLPLSDPFHGNFDVAAIPVTDIVEIRVSLTPASPLDGPGGNGGVIEVLTRAATGAPYLRGQAQAGTAPSLSGALSGRHEVAGLGVRLSATGLDDARDLPAVRPDGRRTTLEGSNRTVAGGLRLEKALGAGRGSLDLAVTHREYQLPPAEVALAGFSTVPDELTLRAVLGGSWRAGGAKASVRAYTLRAASEGVIYDDATLEAVSSRERVRSHRTGGQAQVDVPLGEDVRATAVLHLLIEGGEDEIQGQRTEGRSPVVEPAVGALWQLSERVALEGAVGLAAPLGEARAPAWPELKLTSKWTPSGALALSLTAARKGRLPSLRDRFSPTQGNAAIGPEMGTSGEVAAAWRVAERLTLEPSAFVRLTEGLIRNPPLEVAAPGEPARGLAPVENLGDVVLRGGELRATSTLLDTLTLTAAYAYIEAHSAQLGPEPLDFLPSHRADVAATFRPTPALGLWSRIRSVSAQRDAGNTLEAHATLDAAAWYRLGPARLTLRGENLTDQRYLARAAVQADGRTLYLGAEGKWE